MFNYQRIPIVSNLCFFLGGIFQYKNDDAQFCRNLVNDRDLWGVYDGQGSISFNLKRMRATYFIANVLLIILDSQSLLIFLKGDFNIIAQSISYSQLQVSKSHKIFATCFCHNNTCIIFPSDIHIKHVNCGYVFS